MKYTTIACAVGLALFTVNAQAQQNNEETVEVIQVTGTNIKGVDLEGTQPLTVLTSEDIAKSGANTIAELMRTVSQTRGGFGSFDTTQSGATSTSTPAGQAAASLRGIGPSATLTLVNGRRIAASSFASGTENFVDVNAIPAAAVERVEILATGASAIYGADAVAGVINYILKDNYEGLNLNASYENTTVSADHGKLNLQALWGTEVLGGNLTAFIDFYDRKTARANDFEQTKSPILASSYSYLPSESANIYYWSARDGNEIGAPNCNSPFVTTEFGEDICAYYGNQDDVLETPLESLSAGVTYEHAFKEVTLKADILFSNTESTSFSSPAPINQIDDEEGPWASEYALDFFSDDVRDALLDAMYIDPFITQAGRELYGFRYDARFAAPRTIEIETEAVRAVTSLSGMIGDWDWESGITLSRSRSDQVATDGVYNRYRFTAAVEGELCTDGSIASYDESADSLTCNGAQLMAMYNPFDPLGSDSQAALAVAQAKPERSGTSTVYGWDIKFNGELVPFGDDYIRVATGAEIRREKITDTPTANARARFDNDYLVDVYGFGSSLSEAERTQWGVFAEALIPLHQQVNLSIAGRYDHYDDFGSTFNPKVGLSYRPTDEFIVRASWSTAFRAPSLTQAGVDLRTTRASFDCSANQQVSNLYCEGESSIRGNNVLELGNPLLKAEESESISVGLAYSPTQNTHITLDYWQFEHDDLVDTNMTGVLEQAMTDASLRHCGLVPAGETGISYEEDLCLVTDSNGLTIEQEGANLTEILDAWAAFDDPRYIELPLYRDHVLLLDNTGSQELAGIDFDVIHDVKFDTGTLELGLSATHYLSYDRNKVGSDQIEDLIGQFGYPETVGSAELFWVTDDWYAGLYLYYTSSYADDIARLRGREIDEIASLGALNANDERDVSSWTTLTLSAGYSFEQFDLRLTIENLTDKQAPTVFGSSRGYDAYNAAPYGTRYQLGISYYFN
nr:TonB-dependent receptor [Alteromonas facilis]